VLRPRSLSAWKRASAVLTAVGVALLPKCPACWSVYAGLSSVFGVSFVIEPALLLPLTLTSLALALASLGSMARRTRSYLPFAVGAASALGVWAGKFVLNSDALTWLGLFGLILASLGARRRGPRAASSELPEHAQAR
jgi:hypothetical protein